MQSTLGALLVSDDGKENIERLVELTAEIVAAYVSNNSVPVHELPDLINRVHTSLTGTTGGVVAAKSEDIKPAVPIKKSLTPDYIVCLEDGLKFKSLKRHLSSKYDLSPDEYRAKWGLQADYPMVAPNYATARSELAKSMGLGRKAEEPKKPAKRVRKKVSTAEQ